MGTVKLAIRDDKEEYFDIIKIKIQLIINIKRLKNREENKTKIY